MPKNTTIQNKPHQIASIEDKPIITVTPEQIIKAANGAVVLSIDRCVELVGGTIKQKTFFNLLSQGDAPRRLKVGRRTCFDTAEFAEWFCRRLTVNEAGTKKIRRINQEPEIDEQMATFENYKQAVSTCKFPAANQWKRP